MLLRALDVSEILSAVTPEDASYPCANKSQQGIQRQVQRQSAPEICAA